MIVKPKNGSATKFRRFMYFYKNTGIALVIFWITTFSSAFASDLSPPCPSEIKDQRQLFIARELPLGSAKFSPAENSSDDLREDYTVGLFYSPVRKFHLCKPISALIEPRIKVNRPIHPAPIGYFIAYGSGYSVWLITIEASDYFVTITRLQNAALPGDPDYSRLYWLDENEKYKSQSHSLWKLIQSVQKK